MVHNPTELVGEAGWITGPELLDAVSRSTVQRWISTGALIRLAPALFALPASAPDWRVRAAAAVHGRDAITSHVTALALWDLLEHPPGPVHVTVPRGSSGRGSPGVVVHRTPARLTSMQAGGVASSPPARAIVESWGTTTRAHRAEIRAAAITAVRRRLCTPRELSRELDRHIRLPGRAELRSLVDLLLAGCRSELEIWGCLRVLRAPGMPAFTLQLPVTVAGRTFLLDAACEESMLAVEMDGAAWHGSQTQREADIRRDGLVATIGWQTLRYSYRRLTESPAGCRREFLAVHTARVQLLGTDRVGAAAGVSRRRPCAA
ncbi:hypothetical protein DQ239_04255 [Blastococcus sp. TF02-09]|uniref:DUF559 domain-containing protein n=1 Tax=Blastococcus sp. TF02-09 TaxID=2250576 RepID=UPI000DEBDC48|nr:DUF559 domain-containing protein [Blastococcus sp. TF02-9]RBY80284.1 hypothetical protein DQ239_04255 [Blastococcus sp. TF02-9]